ncbi:MAG: MFS transporter [Thermoplasmata archaeon]|nr:MFS transporter [Thermoplasmata archaeon]
MKNKFILVALSIAIATISMRAVNNMIVTTLPLFGKYILHFSNGEIGLLTSVSFITTFLATSFINPRLSFKTRKISFILSTFLIILILILIFYSNYITIWIFSILAGFSYGLITPNIITSASLIEERKLAERLLAIYSVSLSLSLVLGPLLETFLLKYFNYREIFLLFVPIALPLFIMSFKTKFPEGKNEKFSFKEINKKPLFASVINVMIYNIPFSIITVYAAIYAIDVYHVSGTLAYSIYVPFFTISFITRFLMVIRPFKDLRKPITLSAILTALGVILLAYPSNFYFIIFSMALLGIPHGAIYPISTIIISRGTKINERNAVNSYFVAFGNIIVIVVPPIFGFLIPYLGYRLLIASLVFPVIVFFLILQKKYFKELFMKV